MDISTALDTYDFMRADGCTPLRAFESACGTLNAAHDTGMHEARNILRAALAERGHQPTEEQTDE